jgi:hypothetical protein
MGFDGEIQHELFVVVHSRSPYARIERAWELFARYILLRRIEVTLVRIICSKMA